jgi:prepilin signal peptidase PulO-like enzyme (type II secretory pathway)
MLLAEQMPMPLLLWATLALWLAAVGGCIGSFLNVVVYRLPRGKNLSYPGSACPLCGHPIRWYHNIPIFGWLILRGRCHDCHAPIAPRYPMVEAIVAGIFVATAITGPLAGGMQVSDPLIRTATELPGVVWGRYAYHLLLLCVLLAAAQIEWDGPSKESRFPWLLLFVPLTIGIVAPIFWPELNPVPLANPLPAWLAEQPQLQALAEGLAGIVVGAAMAALAWPATGFAAFGSKGHYLALIHAATIGAFLGWQAAAGLVLCTAAVYGLPVIMALFDPLLRRLPWTMVLWVLTTGWIILWNDLIDEHPLVGVDLKARQIAALIVASISIAAMSGWTWAIARRWQKVNPA